MQNLENKTEQGGFPQYLTGRCVDHVTMGRKRTPRYKLAIFDFDGTLADSFTWFLSVINEVADTYNFRRIKEQELVDLRSFDAKKMLEHVGIPMWKMPLLQRYVRKRMTSDIGRIALFPGIAGLLQGLREEGIALAIVTSNSFINVREVLGRQNELLIQHYACGAPILGKRAKLRKVLHTSGVHPSKAIFIGDEIRDLHAARGEGIDFGAVSWGVNSAQSLTEHSPEEMFSSIDEIAEGIIPSPVLQVFT
ncbi:MAG TPA: HAD hydrolase-like protein [Pyrinomonadaceae bacterium]|nr:HAD hydrolase-like protein [Pyrinomonadaceae bacterium]